MHLCVFCVCVCHNMCIQIRGQFLGINSFPTIWVPKIELKSGFGSGPFA